MNNERFIDKIKDELDSMNDTDLVRINNAYAREMGGTEIHQNNEDFFKTHYGNNLTELISLVKNNYYRINQDWVIVDMYGDLETFDSFNIRRYASDTSDLAVFVSENFNEFSDLFDFDENSFDEEE